VLTSEADSLLFLKGLRPKLGHEIRIGSSWPISWPSFMGHGLEQNETA
jgi:hypothetical protein